MHYLIGSSKDRLLLDLHMRLLKLSMREWDVIDDRERRASPQARICLPVSPNEQAAAQINITETSHNYRHLRVQRFKYFCQGKMYLIYPVIERENFLFY